MALVNDQTGEATIGSGDLHVIYTVDAWVAIETQLGKPVLEILGEATLMRLGFKDLVVIIAAGAEAWRRRFASQSKRVQFQQKAMDLLEEDGLAVVLKDVVESIQHSSALGIRSDSKEESTEAPLESSGETPLPDLSELVSATPGS